MPKKIVTLQQMRAIDRLAVEKLGIPEVVLMENAGLRLAERALEALRRISGRREEASSADWGARRQKARLGRVAVAIGPGNNGGDGLCALRHLSQMGVEARGFLVREKLSGAAGMNLEIARRMGLALSLWDADMDALAGWGIGEGDVVLDAVFGTGLSRPPAGNAASLLTAAMRARARGAFVLSADVPSGLTEHGAFEGAVSADVTCCLGLLKAELFTGAGADLSGSVELLDISIPTSLADELPREVLGNGPVVLLEHSDGRAFLPPRRAGFHKGEAGHVAVLTGSADKSGASALASLAALKSGAGLVTAIGRQESVSAVQSRHPALMGCALEGKGPFGLSDLPAVLSALEGKKCLVAGPGLERGNETALFLKELIRAARMKFIVLDADALNALSELPNLPEVLSMSASPLVLTPHPLEMARLIRSATASVERDRLETARRFAASAGAVVVLKGRGSVIALPDGCASVCPFGCPGMATAGAGDVLSGVIAALSLQTREVSDGVCAAVLAHALSGEMAAQTVGQLGLTAVDLLEGLALVWKRWER